MGDFEKKLLQGLVGSTNEIEKKFLHCCKQEKKMLQSNFIIPVGL